jgi:hypothetical protein
VDRRGVTVKTAFGADGKRIFSDDDVHRPLELLESRMTTTGAILAACAPVRQ